MDGERKPLTHPLSKAVLGLAAVLIFVHFAWMGLSSHPGVPVPDARHTEALRWRGGDVTYLTPAEKLIYDVSFWGGFIGIWLGIALESGLDAVDRRREARGLPKLRF